ncbi:MAG: methyltransferase domain-containing protein [Chloroflexi bacterium]|nr:methyltransferase domain-containing protein [Chloroflexota bacterium]
MATSGQSKTGYIHGYAKASQWMASRTADNFAAFFQPYLSSGMDLLDVGCGPGTITVGLAAITSPGSVVGIDIAASEVEKANAHSKELGCSNATFDVGNATALQFEDAHFDAVFSSALLEHVPDAAGALREMKRVLKPGGVIGLKGGVPSRHIFVPEPRVKTRIWEIGMAVWEAMGGHPEMGLEQLDLVKEAGLLPVDVTGTFWTLPAHLAHYSERLLAKSYVKTAGELGLASLSELKQMATEIEAWEKTPGAFSLVAWIEVVAKKPG